MRHRACLLCAALLPLAGCAPPDTAALKKLACEHAAASIDMGSVSQLDALRKALGVAPGVDPIAQCRALGARMEPAPANGAAPARESSAGGEEEPQPD